MKEKIENCNTKEAVVRKLPVFRGYTVDMRLRQFRKVSRLGSIEFIDFDSPKGAELLSVFLHSTPD